MNSIAMTDGEVPKPPVSGGEVPKPLVTGEATPKPPVSAKFPDPRKMNQRPSLRPKPSVGTILSRTNPEKRSPSELVYLGVEECIADLEAEEIALKDRERDLAKLKAETDERVRVVKETEILLAAREKVLDEREELVARRLNQTAPDQGVAELDRVLKDTRAALGNANAAVAEKDSIIAALRKEMEELKANFAHAPAAGPAPDGPVGSYDEVIHKSLSEQVAFLREREAFIEESENTLFDKAQELQEWETRLQQQEHDLGSEARSLDGSRRDRETSSGSGESQTGACPIDFPRSVASG